MEAFCFSWRSVPAKTLIIALIDALAEEEKYG
jgi:hypothetical protein